MILRVTGNQYSIDSLASCDISCSFSRVLSVIDKFSHLANRLDIVNTPAAPERQNVVTAAAAAAAVLSCGL